MMARQSGGKARTKAVSARARTARGNTSKGGGTAQQQLAVVERERDALRSELKRVQSQMQRLEQTQAQVRDRISWALDSLQNILDNKKK